MTQNGRMSFNLKSKLNDQITLISSTGFDAKALGGKSDSVFGFAFEVKA